MAFSLGLFDHIQYLDEQSSIPRSEKLPNKLLEEQKKYDKNHSFAICSWKYRQEERGLSKLRISGVVSLASGVDQHKPDLLLLARLQAAMLFFFIGKVSLKISATKKPLLWDIRPANFSNSYKST